MARSNRLVRPLVVTLSLFGCGLLAASIAVRRPTLSHAEDRPAVAAASASSSSSPSASAASSAASPSVPKLPIFADDLPSVEKSEVPKPAEWKTATYIDFDRHAPLASCQLLRIREWVRLSCQGPGSMASHISGPSEGWSARTDAPEPSQAWDKAVHWVQFPVRRGERRLMELRSAEVAGWGDSLFMSGGRVISVQWNDGEAPKLVSH